MAACRISYNEEGVATVVNEEGNPSELYGKILEIVEDQDVAINTWSAAVHPDSGLRGENATVEEVVGFMDSHASTGVELKPDELAAVTETLRRNGFESLSEFSVEMNRLFKPNGYIEMPEFDSTGKNLYSQDDLRNLDLVEVNRLLQKVDGHLMKKGEVYSEPYSQEDLYVDTSKKDLFGMSEKLSLEQINGMLLDNIQEFSDDQIERAIKESPFSGLIDRFDTDARFREEILSDFRDLRRIPSLSIIAGGLSSDNNVHYTTVKNTIKTGMSTTRIDAEMEYLASVSDFVWLNNPEVARGVIKEIEKELADMGIDAIGLSDHIASKEVIIDILNEVSLMVKNPTHTNIKSFTDKFQQLVPQRPSSIVELVDNRFDDYNIVHLESMESEASLFNQFGLIKVGEDLYHKVDQTADLDTVLDFLSKQYVEGEFELPSEFVTETDMENKEGVLEDIHSFVASRQEIGGLENKMLYTAYKTIFGHTTFTESKEELSDIVSVETDEEYLKSDFVSDFYEYILQEKVKDSPIYRNILSHIAITDKDISLVGKPVSIKGIEYEQELSDYIRLKRGSRMRYLLEETGTNPIFEDMEAINFPETIKEYSEEYMMHGDHVVLPTTPDNYVKIDDKLYRKSVTNDHSSIFTLITTPKNPVYYTNSTNFEFDKTEAIKELESHQSLVTPTEYNTEDARIEENMFTEKDNIEDYSTILSSGIKLVDLYNEEERPQIVEKIDECG